LKKLIAGGMSATLATLAFASFAVAAPHHPTGDYAQFADCPLNRVTIENCVYQVISGGSFTLGKRTVPLKNPITVQGGFEGEGSAVKFFGAEDGNTISKTPQPVPGGLFGINPPAWWSKAAQEKFNNAIDNGFTGVTATLELAAPATSIKLNTEHLLTQKGTVLEVPAKIKLDNRLLGNNCYIGSSSTPVMLDLTTGTTAPPPPNQPIKGSVGVFSFNEEFTVFTFTGIRLVDNSFAVPKASGCGGLLSAFVDPLVNSLLGTPSPAGRNAAILEGTLQNSVAEAVRANEK
jgi:hypothetical protein